MPTTFTVNMFYIGSFADMDTDESDFDNELPSTVLGTHNTISIVEINQEDQNDDGVIFDDETPTADFLSYDTGGGPTSIALDNSSIYNATILLGNGSTIVTGVLVIQAANGDVFVSDYPGGTSLDNISVQSITLDSLDTSSATGINAGVASVDNSSVVCFASGTLIHTVDGRIPVEKLKVGHQVVTRDHGPQPIRWINNQLVLQPDQKAPVVIKAEAFGPGRPYTDLVLSPHHRVIARSKIAARMFDTSEVLIAAKHLLRHDHVLRYPNFLPVRYIHFACQHHEIISANGLEVETFFPGDQALAALSRAQIDAFQSACPALAKFPLLARTVLNARQAETFLGRLQKNRKTPVELIRQPRRAKAA